MSVHDLTWKGRLIIKQDGFVDLPPDRQEIVGPNESGDRRKFMDLLNEAVPQDVLFGAITDRLLTGEISTRESANVVLFDFLSCGDRILVKGNSNASFGYFYVEARILPASTGNVTSRLQDAIKAHNETDQRVATLALVALATFARDDSSAADHIVLSVTDDNDSGELSVNAVYDNNQTVVAEDVVDDNNDPIAYHLHAGNEYVWLPFVTMNFGMYELDIDKVLDEIDVEDI